MDRRRAAAMAKFDKMIRAFIKETYGPKKTTRKPAKGRKKPTKTKKK